MTTRALVCFSKPNAHPLAWLLNADHRHVFVSVLDIDRDTWVSYDWRQGNPKVQFDAVADYDLETYWRSCGLTVVSVETGDALPWGPWMLNNCVGHTKLLLGVRSWAVTPHGLYLSLTGQTLLDRAVRWLRSMTVVPGGGGDNDPPPVAPTGYEYITGPDNMFSQHDEETGSHLQTYSREGLKKKREGWYSEVGDQGETLNPRFPDLMVADPTDPWGDRRVKASTLNPYQEHLWKEGTKTELKLIPGYTQAGPKTAEGYRPGEEFGDPLPDGATTTATTSTASTASAPPPPVATPKKKPPRKLTSSQSAAGSGTPAGGGTSMATAGDLSEAEVTRRSLLG
jgi:hypothetical protein